ncbi:hypothetical protein N7462_000715, partial [Penicillium macrosclerotiorum]|uniref:uncharacterized protein n=1 Tax=Penicillium macrosclerotiorum TaxID=303699 RepID=UPI002547E1F9
SSLCCTIALPHGPSKNKLAAATSTTINLISELQGFREDFYTDSTGHTTIANIHDPISKAEEKRLYSCDVKAFEKCVCNMENSYVALVSFAYNSGCGGVESYWHDDMTQKNFKGVCKALPYTNTLGGQLKGRRAKEGAYCMQASNQTSGY